MPHAAGTGSALLGTLQSALGAAVAPRTGIAGGHTVIPLFLGMTLCALIATLALWLTTAGRTASGARRASGAVRPLARLLVLRGGAGQMAVVLDEVPSPDETRPARDHAGKPGRRPGCDPQLTL